MSPIALALLGALCWGIAPVFGKLGLEKLNPVDGLAARTLVTLLFVAVWLAGSGRISRIISISGTEWAYLGAEAFFAALAGDLAYYAALKWGTAGVTAVALSLSPLITLWLSSVLLKESFTLIQVAGSLLVMIGMALVMAGI